MLTRISAALIATLVWAVPSLAFSNDEKSPNECDKYLTEMGEALNTLEALVPNVPPAEASYLEKEYPAAINSGSGKRIYDTERRPFFPAWNLHNAFKEAQEFLKISNIVNLKLKISLAAHIPSYRRILVTA
jgi:hypothetical protein